MIKVALIGVGRTGSLAAKKLVEGKFNLVAAFASQKDPAVGQDVGILAGLHSIGLKVSSAGDLAKVLDKAKPDVVVDFTNAEAFMSNLKIVAERRINMVVGTTGFTESQLDEIRSIVKKNNIGLVLSPNM
ncbi:MAG: 4-hydroxy-tetrahydrodipicolinate reductase, partial [Candidatus Altiarchaeota archaeon]